jgi:isoleucyl-tRNA synthetase
MPHTADEAYLALWKINPQGSSPGRCVHVQEFPKRAEVTVDHRWSAVMDLRAKALIAMERTRAEHGVENPLDMGVVLPDQAGTLQGFDTRDVADLLGVSRVELSLEGTMRVLDLRTEPACARSWKRDGTVKQRSDGGLLSDRDAEAVGLA